MPYGFAQMLRTERDPLERAVADGRTTRADADEILGVLEALAAIFDAFDARERDRAAAGDFTDSGRRKAGRADAEAQLAPQVAPLRARLRAWRAAPAEFEARAPRLRRDPDGTVREAPPRRLSAEEQLLEAIRDDRTWRQLEAIPEAQRGARLRKLFDDGDPEGIGAAALRAPREWNLVDDVTRAHAAQAHLTRQGLAEPLDQLAFKARRAERLDEAIASALAAAGLPDPRPPLLRVLPDGSVEPLAPLETPIEAGEEG